MEKKYKPKMEFFASSNSYSGFRTYFDKIFNSYEYDRIFVLKGGPGTGKSTLMRKVANIYDNEKNTLELFRCSSDKNSLDAVIIERDGKRVAIIDGTAPHERDAVIPGAVDMLINLGEAIDESVLSKKKNEVLKLNCLKKESYKKTYYNLSKSSVFASNIKAEIINAHDLEAVSKCCNEIIQRLDCTKNERFDLRLISSFSKEGYSTLDSFKTLDSQCFNVFGTYGSEYIFITLLSDMLTNKSIPHVKIVSPLDPEITEAIYFKDSGIAIVGGDGKSPLCDMCEFLRFSNKNSFLKRIEALDTCRLNYEKEASDCLKEASKYHFELEDMYTAAVDFDILNQKTLYVAEHISKIFS